MGIRIIRLPDVMEQTGLSRSTIYAKMAKGEGDFPHSIKLGARAIGWPSNQIDDWIEKQIQISNKEHGGIQ